jgi:hypothetical protein
MKKVVLMILIFFLSIHLTGMEKDTEFKIVINMSLGSCSKYFFIPVQIIEDILKSNKCDATIRIEAQIRCNRDKELKIFKKQYNWTHDLKRDDGTFTKEYNPENNYDLFIFRNGELISKANSVKTGREKITHDFNQIICPD